MKTLTALVIALCLSTSAEASHRVTSHRVTTDRVTVAAHNGALTGAEVQRLRNEQAEIDSFRRGALRDGRLSLWERNTLTHKENAFDRLFRALTTNRVRR